MQFYSPLLSLLLWLVLMLPSSPLQAAEDIEPALTSAELQTIDWLNGQEQNMLDLLERLTNINSGSLNKAGVDELAAIFRQELRQLGFSITTLPGDVIAMPSCPGSDYDIDVADHTLAARRGTGTRLLLMGHLLSLIHISEPTRPY